MFDIGATAPTITIYDVGFECFEKERKEVGKGKSKKVQFGVTNAEERFD